MPLKEKLLYDKAPDEDPAFLRAKAEGQLDKELLLRQIEHQEIMQTTLDGFWIVDAKNGKLIEVNDPYCRIVGYSRKEILDMSIQELDAFETPEETAARFKKAMEVGYERFETKHRHKLGHLVDFEVSVTHSEVDGSRNFVFFRDISERKRTELDLRDREERLRAIVNQLFCGIVHSIYSGYITFANDRFCEIVGFSRAELLGKEWEDIIHPEDCNRVLELLERHLSQDKPFTFECRLLRKNGEMVWVSIGASMLHDLNARVLGVASIVVDITARKQMELALQLQRIEMEQLQKMHVASQTASAIAHEMNQPLLAIASYCQAALMLMKSNNPDFAEISEAIEKSELQALRAGRSIRDLIEFLSIKDFSVDSVDLSKEISEIVDIAKTDHNFLFNSVFTSDDLSLIVRANRIHVQKVLLNIIYNGIEAMQSANIVWPAITATITSVDDNKFVKISIRDNGTGIRKEDINRLFEPFFTTKAKGIGMGLSISRALIEVNGGQLWAEQEDGSGATFHMTLPRTK